MKQMKFGVFDVILAIAVVAGIILNVYAFKPRADNNEARKNNDSDTSVSQTSPVGNSATDTPDTDTEQTQTPKQENQNGFYDYSGYLYDEMPSLDDFLWFIDEIKNYGLPGDSVVITDFSVIKGYWKAYTETAPMFLDEPEYIEWFNAEISGEASDAVFTFHTEDFFGAEKNTGDVYDLSFREGENLTGEFSGGVLILGDIDNYGWEITIMVFYSRNNSQYAIGEIAWISGEKQNIALYRP